MENLGVPKFKEFVHFGLTSQDINNTAIPLATKEFVESVYIPSLEKLIHKIGSVICLLTFLEIHNIASLHLNGSIFQCLRERTDNLQLPQELERNTWYGLRGWNLN
jgi:hypothetical protein